MTPVLKIFDIFQVNRPAFEFDCHLGIKSIGLGKNILKITTFDINMGVLAISHII